MVARIETTATRQLGIAALALITALLLAWQAWPRLQASLRYLPVDTAISLYFEVSSILTMSPALMTLAATLLLVPLAATAFAPLALASHRHG